ncbi:peptidoglycan-binding protein [Nonomuraea sp. SYSU D8015]|uniref:peptidoglycan-binding protein n=1 Tax=Nonomuraea sp. SYSU D8015 TaxID=2593644 RepID=UPI001CB7403A|nr:peptidoglycan-binding protein [Nonomuraea sp. SYSU D8015]
MAIDLVLRRDWQARAPRGSYTQLDSTRGVKVHYTGGRVAPGIVDDHEECVALVRSIQGYHMDANGWIDIGYCVDEETEILTREGWKSYRELRTGDLALTLDHESGLSEWQPVLEVCVFPARPREMVRIEGPHHSSLTTPHHRWPVERRRTRMRWRRGAGAGKAPRVVAGFERSWVTTETLGLGDRIPLAAPCADLPVEAKWSDAFVELVAWLWADGRAGAAGPAVCRSLEKPVHVARIRAALTSVFGPPAPDGVSPWREVADRRLVEFRLSADAGRRLSEVAPGLDFLLSLTRAQLSLFVETSLASRGDTPVWQDRAAAEAFMFAVLLTGASASLRRLPSTPAWQVDVTGRQHFSPGTAAISRETYHGEIWCPRTGNRSWMARRAGSVYFTGNSYIACPHRKVFEGRGLHHLPAANGPGLNAGHYAVLGLVGNAGLVQPPDGLLHGILDAVQYVRDRGHAGREIKGHRDGYATDCPGEPLYAWVRRGAPRPGGSAPPPPRPVAPPFPGRLLKYPPVMRGEDVRTWQRQMRARGWDVAVDGAYGAESRDVCRRFQREQGVADDGIVGPVTWRLAWEAPVSAR